MVLHYNISLLTSRQDILSMLSSKIRFTPATPTPDANKRSSVSFIVSVIRSCCSACWLRMAWLWHHCKCTSHRNLKMPPASSHYYFTDTRQMRVKQYHATASVWLRCGLTHPSLVILSVCRFGWFRTFRWTRLWQPRFLLLPAPLFLADSWHMYGMLMEQFFPVMTLSVRWII